MNHGITEQEQLQAIESALKKDLIENDVSCVLLIDGAGNTIAEAVKSDMQYDTYALAALAAGNYATIESMASLVGEQEFSQLYHKGDKVSILFGRVSEELLLVCIFDNEVSLGFLRLKTAEVKENIIQICNNTDSAEDAEVKEATA